MENGGRIPRNVTAICETCKISGLMGRHPMKGGSEYHLMSPLFRLARWSNTTQFLPKTCQYSTSSGRKFYPEYSSVMYYTRGRFGELDRMDASELHARRLNAKEVLTPQRSGNFIFPIADGTVSGGDQVLRTSTLIRDQPDRGEEQGNLLGESDGSPPLQDSLPDGGEARNDFQSISGNHIYRHHVEPRVQLYAPKEESFPVPQRFF